MLKLCYGCMQEIEENQVTCPHCGFQFNTTQALPFLPFGYKLSERYIIGKVTKTDVQGIEYIGYDTVMKSRVFITEFMPEKLCGRTDSKNDLVVIKPEFADSYKTLLLKFLKYFRTLAMLRNMNCISNIYDIFTCNNTAYIVEDIAEFIPFTEYMTRNNNIIDWNTARPLFMPLINTLQELHKNNIFHFGISPKALYINSKGKILLRNFLVPDLRQANSKYSYKLISSCSAPEQYDENAKLNEATDVYGLTATLFFALTGKLPDPYEKRKNDSRLLISTNIVKSLPPHVVTALAGGLQLNPDKRIKSFNELQSQLTSAPILKAIKNEAIVKNSEAKNDDIKLEKKTPNFVWGIVSFVISLAIFSGIGFLWYNSSNNFLNIFNFNFSNTASDSSDTDSLQTKTPKMIKVPNLKNYNYLELTEKDDIQKTFNVIFNLDFVFDNEVPQNCIMSQYPEANTEVPEGTAILVTVSKGAKLRELPEIKEKSLDQAAQLLANQMFITTAKYDYNNKIPENYVVGYEAYKAGDKLEYGSQIVIIVSKGKDKTLPDSDTD